jgi:hypothetical protein
MPDSRRPQRQQLIRSLDHLVGFTSAHLREFVALWNRVEQVPLQPQQADKITWTLTTSGDYTTSSAYRAQFVDIAANHVLPGIWKTWAPPKCKFFTGLILQNRVWTSGRLARRNWDHSPVCPLCRTTLESALHLLAECRYSRRIWTVVANWLGIHHLLPSEWTPTTSTSNWWISVTSTFNTPPKACAP